MTPALENRIRDAIREGIAADPNLFRDCLDDAMQWVCQDEGCTPTDVRAV